MLAVYLFKIASWLCFKIPQSISYPLATIGGELYYWIAREHSRNADRNMQIVLGAPKINRRVRLIARRSFRNYAKYMVDFLRLSHPKAPLVPGFTGEGGWSYFEEGLAKGKGLMLFTPHFGNWDGAIGLVNSYGLKIHSVANEFKPPELNDLIQGTRQRMGINIYSPEGALRGLVTALKRNELVVLLIDSPLKNEGVVVEMFGKPVRFAPGPATLALRTGANLMLGYVARQPGNKTFYAVWEPHLKYEPTGDKEQDILALTQQIAHVIEGLIRRHPDQWYMFRPLWLTDEELKEHEEARQQNRRKGRKTVEQ
ncbi:MAG: lysophospholipid acyltransferase family protein [Chloroflexota bacterium]